MILATFFLSCMMEPEGGNQKVVDYVMGENISAQLASEFLQKFIIQEAVNQAIAEKDKPGKKVEEKPPE